MKKIFTILTICLFIFSFISITGTKSVAATEENEAPYSETEESLSEEYEEETSAFDETRESKTEEDVKSNWEEETGGGEEEEEAEPDYATGW